MAQADDIDTDLTLELDGDGVTPERFQRAVRAFFGIVTEVTKNVCDDRTPVRWRVKVKSGSNLIGVVPGAGFSPSVLGIIATAVHDGVIASERNAALPPSFGEGAVRHLRDLSELSNREAEGDLRIRLWADRRAIRVTPQTAIGTDRSAAGQFEDHGSIEGRLQTVSERGAVRFVVYETLADKAVNCFIEPAQVDEAMRNFGKRVEVYGLIKYRGDGSPISIRVESISAFADPDELPDFRSVYGILRQP